ncbi:hypothetical protein Tco_0653738 [Tanacetum coccineum]|uniref:Uncharacterized protein n=1 Tax=Tanacetum coccineum TaxID=301880 RepID=A0ABQ4X195_9ASTR
MSSLDKSRTTTSDLYKGLNLITKLLKEINNAVKDNPAINKKISKATESFSKISTNITEAHALKQDEKLAAWAKSSTNMAWNLRFRISGLEQAQKHIQSNMSSLKEDTLSIKTMMTEMYEVFKGQSLGSVTLTLALTHILANVEGENATNTSTEDPPSHTEGETDANKQEKPNESKHSIDANIEFIGKCIATDEQVEDQRKLVKASSIIRPDPDALNPYTINRELCYLTTKQLEVHIDKEERIKKAKEEAMLFKISKNDMIKVVQEEAKKLGIHPKKVITTKAGEIFMKAQDAKHEVIKRQHTEKVRKSLELRKHQYDNYMWTIISRLKPEPITDIKIHLKTKPVVITVYRGTGGRNFDVHKPFAFARRYERIRKIPEELEIKSALPTPAPAPEQTSSKSSRKKRKHMESKTKTKTTTPSIKYAIYKYKI